MVVGFIFISLIALTAYYIFFSKNNVKETTWEAHESPEEAGFSSERLAKARSYYEALNSTAFMVIYDGKVLVSWGDVSKNTNAHSVRKSFLSALYGIHMKGEQLHLNDTLETLEIDDSPPLTYLEKQATIRHLLTSTSGVYHEAGEESWRMRRNRPGRETHEAGSHFYYNNWDFNVLGTIFNKQTNLDLFKEFKEAIADPIGMEDFTLLNTTYKEEPQFSIHPSYLFQMSARDMARFGQLYLQEGAWAGQQLIPKDWIKLSTTAQAKVPNNAIYSYGYMWWVATESPFSELGLYSAIGRYGQSIDIIPEKNMVFVHRVDSNPRTFRLLNRSVNQEQRLRLLELILEAQLTKEELMEDERS
ncbi:serine hydrolase domain-containing protein [Halalkalibacter urbisdiaboli]|uniref:serine hydrolase domain-containing protein n=1 Tax=Halalkalibacter urbisdiaboli TaxID=1960589 RepID=UPI000B4449DB|nr:serine hydrolase [Halalkalibacter urbisdiaboli]